MKFSFILSYRWTFQFLKLILFEFSSLPVLSIFFTSQSLIFQARRRKRKKWYLYESAFFFPPPRFPTNSSSCFSSSLPDCTAIVQRQTTLPRGIETRVRSDSLSRHSQQTQHLHRTSAHWPPSSYRILMNSIFIWHIFYLTISPKKLYSWKWSRLEIITFFEKKTLFLRNKFFLYRIIRQRSSTSYV